MADAPVLPPVTAETVETHMRAEHSWPAAPAHTCAGCHDSHHSMGYAHHTHQGAT